MKTGLLLWDPEGTLEHFLNKHGGGMLSGGAMYQGAVVVALCICANTTEGPKKKI